jgi:hypothetical protein
MTKRLHLIAVSDDFRTFLHVHPELLPSGQFVLAQTFPRRSLYHLYADAEPQGMRHQVFRFDLPVGSFAHSGLRDLSERRRTADVGPYTINLSTLTLHANKPTPIVVHVRRGNRPASDLHPYLGAEAHAVFLNAVDLSYVHVHPMPLSRSAALMRSRTEMPSMPDGAIAEPNMFLNVTVDEPGVYKLWMQFRGGSTLYVAPFVLNAK